MQGGEPVPLSPRSPMTDPGNPGEASAPLSGRVARCPSSARLGNAMRRTRTMRGGTRNLSDHPAREAPGLRRRAVRAHHAGRDPGRYRFGPGERCCGSRACGPRRLPVMPIAHRRGRRRRCGFTCYRRAPGAATHVPAPQPSAVPMFPLRSGGPYSCSVKPPRSSVGRLSRRRKPTSWPESGDAPCRITLR